MESIEYFKSRRFSPNVFSLFTKKIHPNSKNPRKPINAPQKEVSYKKKYTTNRERERERERA